MKSSKTAVEATGRAKSQQQNSNSSGAVKFQIGGTESMSAMDSTPSTPTSTGVKSASEIKTPGSTTSESSTASSPDQKSTTDLAGILIKNDSKSDDLLRYESLFLAI